MPVPTFSLSEAYGPSQPAPMTGYAGGSLEAATKEQRLILNHEANDPKYTPDERAAVQREIARLPKEPEEKQNTFSIKDAYGDKPITPEPMSEGRKMASSLYSGAQDVASLGDMFLNLGTNIPAVMGMMNRYGQGVATGESHKVTSEAARQVFDRINSHAPNLLQNLLSLVPNPNPNQPNGNESHVAKAMDVFTNLTDQEARELSYKTDPVMDETDWKNLRDVAMIALGTKGLEATGEGLAKSVGKEPPVKPPAVEPKGPKLEDEIPTPEKAPQPASAKQMKALQAQVRQKYTDDAQYAQAFNERAKSQAMIQNGLNGLTKAVEDRAAAPRANKTPTILTPEGKIDTSAIGQRSLDTGLRKITSKQAFLLTPEEKVAIRGSAKAWGGLIEKGAADPDLLAAMAIGGVGTALALAYPEKVKEAGENLAIGAGLFFSGSLHDVSGFSPSTPLGVLRDTFDNSFKVLDRLDGKRFDFGKQQIESELRRPDVGKAEKEIFSRILANNPGDRISAKQIAEGLAEETGNYRLTKKSSTQYNDYGLEAIGRNNVSAVTSAESHLWELPEHMELSAENHFGVPNLFGHTRTFVEDGVRHVVEVQSDLTQNLGKRLLPEDESELRSLYPTPERSKALNDSAIRSQIDPMVKDSYKRLIREELADASKLGKSVVRFATGDTAAKVENWPNPVKNASRRIEEHLDDIAELERGTQESIKNWKGDARLLDNVISHNKFRVDQIRAIIANDQEIIDRLAKEGRQFSPAHQSIYDRYQGPMAKFLKGLGGKEITDTLGHTWIEVPAEPLGRRAQMFGRSKPEVLTGIAVAGLGMAVGAKLDPNNPIEGAVLGVLGAAFLRSGAIGKMKETAEKISAPDTRIRINDLTERLSHHIAQGARTSWQASGRMINLVPDKARREAITRAIDAGTTGELKGKEAELADYQHRIMEAALEMGRKYGVLDAAVDDYITHFWQRNGKSEEALKQLARAKYQQGMSPVTRFSKARIYTSLEEGKAAGLIPLTEDVAVITDMYLNSVYRAIANKRFLDNLHHAKAPGGIPLVLKAAKAPPIYETIDHPLLRNYRVHPDIVPSLKFLFDSTEPSKTMTALSAINTAIKRNAVSISLFHAKSLLDAAIGASNHPGLAIKVLAQTAAPKVFGENRYLKMEREGGAGDLPDTAQRDGVVFSFSRHEPSVEDVTGSYYKGMKWLQNSLDNLVPGLGLPIKGVAAINHMLDDFMWGRLHAAFKLEIYAAKKEALMRNTAKAGKGLTDEQAGRIAASYTNDVFGGLNWQRIAEDASTKWGRDIALELLSPKGRRMTQLALFAPDWTLSTTRALLQARPRRIGLKASIEGTRDLFSAKTLQDLHRQQFIRSALWYVTVGDGINYAMTGHHIWENKNPLRVDLGNGLSMQLSKHFTEPLEWFREPGQQALNKLGYLPSEALDQMQGTQWLSSSGHAKRMDTSPLGRVKHAARAALPFSMNQFVESNGGGGARSAISGTLGVPIYGQTPSEKRQARLDAALKKYHERYGQ